MKILKELFYVPKYGKVKEKTFFAQLAASITVIVLCMAAMSFSAYAYFSCSVTSGVNTITAANFDLDVTVTNSAQQPVTISSDGNYELSGDSYTFVLKKDGTASVGYGKIAIYQINEKNERQDILLYYSAPLTDENTTASVTFAYSGHARLCIEVIAEWGTPAARNIVRNEALVELDGLIGHVDSYEKEENRTEATCTVDGSYDLVTCCADCHEELSRKPVTVPAEGHTEGSAVVENKIESTCTADGSFDSVVYCTGCSKEISRETVTISATGHSAGTPVTENYVEATETAEGGYDEVTYCTVCSETLSRIHTDIPATGDTANNEQATDPTDAATE